MSYGFHGHEVLFSRDACGCAAFTWVFCLDYLIKWSAIFAEIISLIHLEFVDWLHCDCVATQFTVEPEKAKPFSSMVSIEQGQNMEPKHVDPSGDTSDDNVVTVPTGKGGVRRKHHRAWTLSEVMKLVEGVSRYGAGRWSEIKRLAFASYSYRTSVDLKVRI